MAPAAFTALDQAPFNATALPRATVIHGGTAPRALAQSPIVQVAFRKAEAACKLSLALARMRNRVVVSCHDARFRRNALFFHAGRAATDAAATAAAPAEVAGPRIAVPGESFFDLDRR
jgi:hypothetical protein